MELKKRSFFERLTGSIRATEEEPNLRKLSVKDTGRGGRNFLEEEKEEMELAVDVYQTPTDIIVQTMVAGVRPEDLEVSIARDMITIRGKREESRTIDEENYFSKELYWGNFSRTILLPQEVEPEEAEAMEKHGLLTIRLTKLDKGKKANLKVKSI
ncbi:hypothetical protein A2933_01385 [Candidatus Nomurabacteria bacterium RIFCSPLOWO2_01_FULL_46_18]|uniref:SHSP domain-containing protein n=1 Tax=Candidatus Nomurabacteria bacterium RIFCSPLOWO2_01_FULL_46_18 TaxID=1801783 RepID=A0A1F6XBE7_9BACT|nr:MAG: hypothetical protein A2933_01385 [Candidatus Nomurabacteria bacterium RIFCSPLOWO2_01_FULL_46_18]